MGLFDGDTIPMEAEALDEQKETIVPAFTVLNIGNTHKSTTILNSTIVPVDEKDEDEDLCPVCCSVSLSTKRLGAVPCSRCDYRACAACVKRFLVNNATDPQCMNDQCKVTWTKEHLYKVFPRSFVNNDLKKQREHILYDREVAMLPATQAQANRTLRTRETEAVLKEILRRLKLLQTRAYLYSRGWCTFANNQLTDADMLQPLSAQETELMRMTKIIEKVSGSKTSGWLNRKGKYAQNIRNTLESVHNIKPEPATKAIKAQNRLFVNRCHTLRKSMFEEMFILQSQLEFAKTTDIRQQWRYREWGLDANTVDWLTFRFPSMARTLLLIKEQQDLRHVTQREIHDRRNSNQVNWDALQQIDTRLQHLKSGVYRDDDATLRSSTTTADSASSTDEKQQVIEPAAAPVCPCPAKDCRGYVMSKDWRCGMCSAAVCRHCREVVTSMDGDPEEKQVGSDCDNGGYHRCNPDTVKSVATIVQHSKPCPTCHVPIQRSYGCDHMFCPECKTIFHWQTLKIGKTSSNPLYYEWRERMARENGGAVAGTQRPGMAGACGDDSSADTLYRQNFNNESKREFFTNVKRAREGVIQIALDIDRININLPNKNIKLRVLYILGDVTQQEFRRRLQIAEKHHEIRNMVQELLRGFAEISREQLRELTQSNVVARYKQVLWLANEVNAALRALASTFDVVPWSVDTTLWELHQEGMLKKKRKLLGDRAKDPNTYKHGLDDDEEADESNGELKRSKCSNVEEDEKQQEALLN